MKLPQNVRVPNQNDILHEGVQALVEKLGITKAAIFLSETSSEVTDYLQLKDELFGNLTVQDIVIAMQDSHNGTP